MKPHSKPTRRPFSPTDRLLGLGAIVMLGFLALLLAKSPSPAVEAGMVVSSDTFTLMTAAARTGGTITDEDALYIIDNHNGILLVYRTQVQGGAERIVLVDGGFVEDLFATVRN